MLDRSALLYCTLSLGVPFNKHVQRLQRGDALTFVSVVARTWLRVRDPQ